MRPTFASNLRAAASQQASDVGPRAGPSSSRRPAAISTSADTSGLLRLDSHTNLRPFARQDYRDYYGHCCGRRRPLGSGCMLPTGPLVERCSFWQQRSNTIVGGRPSPDLETVGQGSGVTPDFSACLVDAVLWSNSVRRNSLGGE